MGEQMNNHTFTFLGTGSGCGVPAFFCSCPACEEARQNPRASRGNCGVMIRGTGENTTLLIDTPPDIRHQLNREKVSFVDEILFTHCHSDHIGGLLEMEYMMQLVSKKKIPCYASSATLNQINKEFDYMVYALDEHILQPFETYTFDSVRYTALPVTHTPGTYGYLIETSNTQLFYACDTARLPKQTTQIIEGVDILAMDATYWKKCWTPNTHHSIQECIEEGLTIGAKTIYLTHLCMHYDEPITLTELEEYLKQYNGRVKCALDGLSFSI